MMVPFADFINHGNIDSSYEIIHKDVHPASKDDNSLPKAYFTVSKSEVDYSDLYERTSTEAHNSNCSEASSDEQVEEPIQPEPSPADSTVDDFADLAKITNNKSINKMKLLEARNQVLQARKTIQLLQQT